MRPLVFINIMAMLLLSNILIHAGERDDIRLIIRADDMGFCHSANMACIKGYREGIITTVEVIVPGPWFLDAAKLLAENPGPDAGVHLALKHIPQVSHISDHMNVASCRPDIKDMVDRLSKGYNLPLGPRGLTGSFELWAVPTEKKEEALADSINSLANGLWECICHPVLNNEETQGIEGTVNDPDIRMAVYRQAVTDALTGEKIKTIIRQREIKLVSYSDTYK